ncbi:MAG: NAD(P)H-hydrate epimerase [Candidatus Margulisiibacteriota bacterium]
MLELRPYNYQICTVSEARARDSWAIKNLKIPSIILMENAGIQVVNTLCHPRGQSPEILKPEDKVLVLCGSGNNAGDGLVIARHLYRLGVPVDVLMCYGIVDTEDAEKNYEIAEKLGIELLSVFIASDDPDLNDYNIIIDAVYGIGFKYEIRDETVKDVFDKINEFKQRKKDEVTIVSVDIPSGLDADTGKAAQSCIKADITVVLDCMKKGLLQESATEYVGEVVVVDIGIPVN